MEVQASRFMSVGWRSLLAVISRPSGDRYDMALPPCRKNGRQQSPFLEMMKESSK
jgi:hypothetical protein